MSYKNDIEDPSKRLVLKGLGLFAAGAALPGLFSERAEAAVVRPERNLQAQHSFSFNEQGPIHPDLTQNADKAFYTASLIKLVTIAVALEEIEAGRLDLNETLKISSRAKIQSSHRSELDEVTVAQALEMAGSCSLNDVTIALAERIFAGKPIVGEVKSTRYEQGFVEQYMNPLVQKLKMYNTLCTNATGLPLYSPQDQKNGYETMELPNSYSTLEDMEKLVRHIVEKYPKYLHIFSKPVIDIEGRKDHVFNTNLLLDGAQREDAEPYPDVFGMKSGYGYASGFNLICLKRHGDDVLCSMTTGNSKEDRALQPKAYLAQTVEAYDKAHPKPSDKPKSRQSVDPCLYQRCEIASL